MLSTKPQLSKAKRHQRLLIGQDTTRMTRGLSKKQNDWKEFYTKCSAKEVQSSLTQGLLRWQSVCSHSNPMVTIKHLMIGRNQRTRSRLRGA
ncbi:hypothetical protein Tco_1529437, partial [Tanacetum coccineum]